MMPGVPVEVGNLLASGGVYPRRTKTAGINPAARYFHRHTRKTHSIAAYGVSEGRHSVTMAGMVR